jgi:hypothetical protein
MIIKNHNNLIKNHNNLIKYHNNLNTEDHNTTTPAVSSSASATSERIAAATARRAEIDLILTTKRRKQELRREVSLALTVKLREHQSHAKRGGFSEVVPSRQAALKAQLDQARQSAREAALNEKEARSALSRAAAAETVQGPPRRAETPEERPQPPLESPSLSPQEKKAVGVAWMQPTQVNEEVRARREAQIRDRQRRLELQLQHKEEALGPQEAEDTPTSSSGYTLGNMFLAIYNIFSVSVIAIYCQTSRAVHMP